MKDGQFAFSQACFCTSSFQVTTWRASWEKRSVRSWSWSESSPGNLSSGWALRKSACEANPSVRAANDIHLESSAGSKDLRTGPEPVQTPS